MAKRIKDTDYLVISARIRAMENGLLTRERMEQILEARERRRAGPTAPARGLTLIEMKYVD